MNSNGSSNFRDEFFLSLASHYQTNQLEKMCQQLEAEMAAYSQQVSNYLQLLKSIRDEGESI